MKSTSTQLRILFALFFFIWNYSFSQRTVFKKYESADLGDIRDVKIHLPKGYNKDSISKFPLTIVLEEEKLFDLYTGYASYFASQDQAPEQIVVGINSSRSLNKDFGFDPESGKLTSQSRLFYTFLRDELIPYLENNYKTSPFISIVGEGLSGNFILHYLQEEFPVFNAYVSLNPTLPTKINTQIEGYKLARMSSINNSFYCYISGNPFNTQNGEITQIAEFGKFMKSQGIKNFNVTFDAFSRSPSITSVTGEAISRAFSKVFETYSGISQDEYNKNIKNLDPPSAIAYLERKYVDIELLFGANIGIRQRDVVAIEDIIIEKENGDYLKDFGEMILKVYPTSEMGNYYLGRYYESGNDFKSALREYRLGYGKMNPADPNADLYYRNVERVLGKQ